MTATSIQLIDLQADDEAIVQQAAQILVAGFKVSGAWPDMESALHEVHQPFRPGRFGRVAMGENGRVRAWVASPSMAVTSYSEMSSTLDFGGYDAACILHGDFDGAFGWTELVDRL